MLPEHRAGVLTNQAFILLLLVCIFCRVKHRGSFKILSQISLATLTSTNGILSCNVVDVSFRVCIAKWDGDINTMRPDVMLYLKFCSRLTWRLLACDVWRWVIWWKGWKYWLWDGLDWEPRMTVLARTQQQFSWPIGHLSLNKSNSKFCRHVGVKVNVRLCPRNRTLSSGRVTIESLRR
jgi:hypothetical protein